MRKSLLLSIITFVLFSISTKAQKRGQTITLFDEDLSLFEKWNGVPHKTIQGLPEGTYQSDNVHKGTALGLNNDLKNVFTIIKENNEPVLKITGEIYGGLTTKASYKNYHLSIYFKWGDKKWEPRLEDLRDSGILYHAHGEHGSFWNTWKASLEYQVQDTDLGDFIPLGGTTGQPKVEIRGTQATPRNKYNPNSNVYLEKIGYTSASKELDMPHGEWNHLEIYVVGNDAVHLVNGEIVMVIENATKKDGSILDQGQIQLQSEAAECYYKQFTLTGIKKFPKKIKKQVKFK